MQSAAKVSMTAFLAATDFSTRMAIPPAWCRSIRIVLRVLVTGDVAGPGAGARRGRETPTSSGDAQEPGPDHNGAKDAAPRSSRLATHRASLLYGSILWPGEG